MGLLSECVATTAPRKTSPYLHRYELLLVEMNNHLNEQSSNSRGDQDFNVYFARGHGFDFIAGNILYRKLIRENTNVYKAAKKQKEKRHIVNYIINQVHLRGGKFYYQCKTDEKETSFEWKVSSEEKLKIKVRQSLRDSKGDETLSSGGEEEDTSSGREEQTNYNSEGAAHNMKVADEPYKAPFQMESSCRSVSPIKHQSGTQENDKFFDHNDADKMTFLKKVISIDDNDEGNNDASPASPRCRQESFATGAALRKESYEGCYNHYFQPQYNSYQYSHQREDPRIMMATKEESTQLPHYDQTRNHHHHHDTYYNSSYSTSAENNSSCNSGHAQATSFHDSWSMNQDNHFDKMPYYSSNHSDQHDFIGGGGGVKYQRGEIPQKQDAQTHQAQQAQAEVQHNHQSTDFQSRKDATLHAYYPKLQQDEKVEPPKDVQNYQYQTNSGVAAKHEEEQEEGQIQSILNDTHHELLSNQQLEIEHSPLTLSSSSLSRLHPPSEISQSAQDLLPDPLDYIPKPM